MLTLRVGESTAPVPLDCSMCKAVLPAREPFPIIETYPLDENNAVEFETLCRGCFQALKDKALKFQIPMEFDIEPPKLTKLVITPKLRND